MFSQVLTLYTTPVIYLWFDRLNRRRSAVGQAAAPPAAPPGPSRVTSAVELSLVNLDVAVTGKGGEPVPGLTAADFMVLHDGKPVTITNFREERPPSRLPGPSEKAAPLPGPPALPAGAPLPEASEVTRPRRHVVLFVDRLALPDQRERREFFDALRAFLRKGIGPGDDAMVVSWDRSVRTVQRFTSDLGELDRALEAAEKGAIRIGGEQAEVDRLASEAAWFRMVGQGDTGPSRRMDAQEAYQQVKGKTTALRGLIAMMAGMEGRKALVVASRRLSRRAGYEFGAVVDARPLLESVAVAANAAGVTLHTIYSTAWEFEGPMVAAPRVTYPRASSPVNIGQTQANWNNEMESLVYLAEQTGGVAAGGTLEAGSFAERVATDLESWYSLAYPVPEGARGSAELSVRCRAPGATVRSRRSFLVKSPVEQMQDRVLANLFQTDRQASLPVAVILGVPDRAGKRLKTRVEVRVPLGRLVLLPGPNGGRGALSVFTVAAEPDGGFSDPVRERKEVEVPPGPPPSWDAYVSLTFDVETGSPDARISLGVWDEVGGGAGFRTIQRAQR